MTDQQPATELLKRKVAWGKEIDGNHLFSYENFGEMIEEAESRAARGGDPK